MNKKEFQIYLDEKHINPQYAKDLAEKEGLRTSNQIYKRLEEDRYELWLIGNIVHEAERMKNAYFWEPPSSASSRRSYEKSHSWGGITWEEGGDTYYARFHVRCTCRHIDVTKIFQKNDVGTNLTAIRNSYKRMAKNFYSDKRYIPSWIVYKFE